MLKLYKNKLSFISEQRPLMKVFSSDSANNVTADKNIKIKNIHLIKIKFINKKHSNFESI